MLGSTLTKVPRCTRDLYYYQFASNLPVNYRIQQCLLLKSGSRLIIIFIIIFIKYKNKKPRIIIFQLSKHVQTALKNCHIFKIISKFTLKITELSERYFILIFIMGCKQCSGVLKQLNPGQKAGQFSAKGQAQPIPQDQPRVSATVTHQIPYFMNRQVYKIFINVENIFKDIQISHNGTPVKGTLIESWVPAGQGLMYKGEWDSQKKHGKGILYHQIQQSLIAGCFYQDNLIRTNCRKIYSNGTEYIGQLNQVYELHGVGKVIGKTYIYKGQLKNDRFDGKGKLLKDKINFQGKFKNGQKTYGMQKSSEGIYEGPFQNDLKQGKGVFKWVNGGKYEGSFVKDKIHGMGKLYDADGKYCGIHKFQSGKKIL